MRRRSRWAVTILLGGLWAAPVADAESLWQTEDLRLSAGGHVKGFLIGGQRLVEDREFLESRDRVALEADLEAFRRLRLKVEYRVEAFGSILGSADFAQIQRESERDFLDLDWTLMDEPDLFVRHRLHRAVVSLDVSPLRVAVGRQRIAWGTGKLWSPTDLFNPVNPLSLERGERRGADAALATLALGSQVDVTGVYAPLADGSARGAARGHATVRGVDISALAGARPGEWFLGGDFASPVGKGLVRGEAITAFKDDGRAVVQGVVAGEYTFPNSLGVVVEYFENGEGKARTREFEVRRLLAGEIVALGERFLGAIVGYDLTPLWRAEVVVLWSLTDGSSYVNPRLTYAVTPNAEVGVAAGVTSGRTGSEFGRLSDLYYAEFRWAF